MSGREVLRAVRWVCAVYLAVEAAYALLAVGDLLGCLLFAGLAWLCWPRKPKPDPKADQ